MCNASCSAIYMYRPPTGYGSVPRLGDEVSSRWRGNHLNKKATDALPPIGEAHVGVACVRCSALAGGESHLGFARGDSPTPAIGSAQNCLPAAAVGQCRDGAWSTQASCPAARPLLRSGPPATARRVRAGQDRAGQGALHCTATRRACTPRPAVRWRRAWRRPAAGSLPAPLASCSACPNPAGSPTTRMPRR